MLITSKTPVTAHAVNHHHDTSCASIFERDVQIHTTPQIPAIGMKDKVPANRLTWRAWRTDELDVLASGIEVHTYPNYLTGPDERQVKPVF